ncbi:prolyl-tRNA synthetase associated domain-containing protein [Candidatus Villigracilis affinis]|uniref:prolyl-tRNA synthetase associated domain-containing protein n=1 Tax=Candidatus Villigracilis affinis TaxID=3140682 RepID=UPI002A22CF9D|nr:prolyl-tRNA synthetase associated domain-containing protein [Anaerolineales bacterium]
MITTEKEFLEFMDANGFVYERLEHPAVFTCAEADLHHAGVEAVSTKNLFLCDKKARRFFLAVTACEKTVKLDELTSQLGVAHLRFGSEENLMRLLGVTRGSVTMMGLANDSEHAVELWIDDEIWRGEQFLCHPLVNTATLILSKAELQRFFALTGHAPKFFKE